MGLNPRVWHPVNTWNSTLFPLFITLCSISALLPVCKPIYMRLCDLNRPNFQYASCVCWQCVGESFWSERAHANMSQRNDWMYSKTSRCVCVCVCVSCEIVEPLKSLSVSLHRCHYFLSSSHLVIWGADKKRTAWWFISFFFFFPPTWFSSSRSFISEWGAGPDGERLYPFFFFLSVMSEAAVRHSLSASSLLVDAPL